MRIIFAAAMLAGLAVQPATAQTTPTAQPTPAETLGQCMAMKTTGEDRILVAGWMLAGMASAPQMAGIVAVAPDKKQTLDRGMATLLTRLMVRDCPDAARAVFKLKSTAAFEVAGESLGRVAVRELLTNPQATAALGAYVKYLNEADFKPVTTP